MAYSNLFAWMIILSKLLSAPELDVSDIGALDSTEIKIEKIIQKIQVDDVILNTDQAPYLYNFMKNAIDHQEKIHYIVHHPYIDKKTIELWAKTSSKFNHDGLSIFNKIKFWIMDFYEIGKKDELYQFATAMNERFRGFENDLNNALNTLGLKPNIKFIDINAGIKAAQEIYSSHHQKDLLQCERFNKRFEKQILSLYSFGTLSYHSQSNKGITLDTLKILGILSINDNVLFSDLDNTEYFNLDIPKESVVKFTLQSGGDLNHAIELYKNAKSIGDKDQIEQIIDDCCQADWEKRNNKIGSNKYYYTCLGCTWALAYFGKEAKKILLIMLDVFLNKPNLTLEITMHILVSFFAEKNFQNQTEVMNFIKETSYDDIYNEFNQYYQNFINKYYNIAYNNNLVPSKQFLDLNSDINNNFYYFENDAKQKLVQSNFGSTWFKDFRNTKNNIFKQIESLRSCQQTQ